MNLLNFIKCELSDMFSGWGKYEKIFFPIVIIAIIITSLLMNDNKIALLSAICGISYTILAGKGKIFCYIFGLTSTVCYSYLSLINGFYGNLILNSCYYFPMQIIGILKWKKHLKKDKKEIIKTTLSKKEQIIYFAITLIGTAFCAYILHKTGDKNPMIDSFTTIFSILGMFLTVKRCIEQWYVWFMVNLLSAIMWIVAHINGSNCFATVIMWLVYLVLAVYFLKSWKKELALQKTT